VPDHRNAELLLQALPNKRAKLREVGEWASRLAERCTSGVLLGVLEQLEQADPSGDLRGCLAQEMVLRGVILEGVETAERLASVLEERKHGLAWLPLSLIAIDGDLRPWLPRYGEGANLAWSRPSSPSQRTSEPLPTRTDTILPSFVVAATLASSDRIAAAVRNWQDESNGQIEANVIEASRPVVEAELSIELLLSLGLPCLEGAPEHDVRGERMRAQEAFALLFSAACNGGCYNHGLKGAYGRLAAWQSMAALTGAPPDAEVAAVGELAQKCLWVSFDAASDWFYQIQDLGLVAVRPGGRSLAVLAATDTD
jgi:hypothetical protein